MPRARLPGTMRNCYLADEQARKANEVLQGAYIGAIVAVLSVGMVLGWLWIRAHAYA